MACSDKRRKQRPVIRTSGPSNELHNCVVCDQHGFAASTESVVYGLYVNLSSICLSSCVSIYLSICLSIHPSIYLHIQVCGGNNRTYSTQLPQLELKYPKYQKRTWSNRPSENRTHGHAGIGMNSMMLLSRAEIS